MDLGLQHKTALVLGGGGGLGSAIGMSLAREGVQVALADIDGEASAKTAQAIAGEGGKAFALQWDIADLAIGHTRIGEIEAALGPVDILVNNTGGPPPTPASGQNTSSWSHYFQTMVLSVINVTDLVLPGMRARKWGRIITSTSSGVVAPIPHLAMSNALRLSLVGWSKTLAHETACDGVTVNIVTPGRIATQRIKFLDEQKAKRENRSLDEVIKESTGAIPIGRYGDPQEYGDVVTFLASPRAAYVTGSITRVDGGYIPSI